MTRILEKFKDRQFLSGLGIGLVLGLVVTYIALPPKIITKEVTKTVTKIVEVAKKPAAPAPGVASKPAPVAPKLAKPAPAAKPGAKVVLAPPAKPNAAPKKVFDLKKINQTIAKKGNQYVMDKKYKEYLIEGPGLSEALNGAKVVPTQGKDGKIIGWKFANISFGSIYGKIGLRKNDIVRKINGAPLTDAASAIKLLQNMRQTNLFNIELTRKDKPMTLQVQAH